MDCCSGEKYDENANAGSADSIDRDDLMYTIGCNPSGSDPAFFSAQLIKELRKNLRGRNKLTLSELVMLTDNKYTK